MAEKPFDHIYEIQALAGETLALQAILFGILPRLAALSPEVRQAIVAGFDDAANLVEHIAIKAGDQAAPVHAAKALDIVERLRATTVGKPQSPKHIV